MMPGNCFSKRKRFCKLWRSQRIALNCLMNLLQNLMSVADPEADNEASASGNMWSEADSLDSLNGISSYEHFVEHINLELKKIEDEVVAVLRYAGLVIESKEKLENLKIQQLLDILDSIQHIRERLEIKGSSPEK
ncbi:unnamed protein product [Cuscuta europaea]|uniref:Uncharacterized protein n=1 Tax=Cuscuta europaea TaxID=41803 RepID=A0A9P0ZIC9_CUSEU|nr:unnamed protein product [Cuscuta europaea]